MLACQQIHTIANSYNVVSYHQQSTMQFIHRSSVRQIFNSLFSRTTWISWH